MTILTVRSCSSHRERPLQWITAYYRRKAGCWHFIRTLSVALRWGRIYRITRSFLITKMKPSISRHVRNRKYRNVSIISVKSYSTPVYHPLRSQQETSHQIWEDTEWIFRSRPGETQWFAFGWILCGFTSVVTLLFHGFAEIWNGEKHKGTHTVQTYRNRPATASDNRQNRQPDCWRTGLFFSPVFYPVVYPNSRMFTQRIQASQLIHYIYLPDTPIISMI